MNPANLRTPGASALGVCQTEYLERIDTDARKKAQESLDVVIRGDRP